MRLFGTSSRRHAGKVFPALQTPEQVNIYINTPHGSLRDLMPKAGNHVDGATVRKMLKLSGFDTNITKDVEQKWTHALNTQVGFINHLHHGDVESKTNASVFRPIASDHSVLQALDLCALKKQVEDFQKIQEEPWEARTYIKDTIKL